MLYEDDYPSMKFSGETDPVLKNSTLIVFLFLLM